MPPTRTRPRARPPAFVVRKHDRNGRAYYIDRVGGGRTSRDAWLADLERRRFERAAYEAERARADAEEQDRRRAEREARKRERERELGGGAGPDVGEPFPPGGGGQFPPDVDEDGVPDVWYDEDGIAWEAHEIEGEDETG